MVSSVVPHESVSLAASALGALSDPPPEPSLATAGGQEGQEGQEQEQEQEQDDDEGQR